MKITFTKHAIRKFKFLKESGWKFQKRQIVGAIKNPDRSLLDKKPGTAVVLKKLDRGHDLLVVYARFGDIL